jgi:hypothetical protein
LDFGESTQALKKSSTEPYLASRPDAVTLGGG